MSYLRNRFSSARSGFKGKAPPEYAPGELEKWWVEYRQCVETVPIHCITDYRLEKTSTFTAEDKPVLTDGPFPELAEIIASLVIIQAAGAEEATRLGQSAPLVRYFNIMVRPGIITGHSSSLTYSVRYDKTSQILRQRSSGYPFQ